MARLSFGLVSLLAFISGAAPTLAQQTDAPPTPSGTQLSEARAAAKDLGESLKSQLVGALKSGGPRAAVGACRTIAPAIAADASSKHGLQVGRTALKLRNPANAPDEFERQVMEDFVRKIAAGADPVTLEYAEVRDEGGERVFRYMKAIPTASEPCLACHGGNVAPDLKSEIERLYPADQAIGFEAGDLRGAFTVKQRAQ